jgi:ADP-ribosyl-[dinitrogen reductase] hydrolase
MNQDKAAGSMFGLAIGDAMGMPVEFRPRGKFEPVTEFRAGGLMIQPCRCA